MDWLDDLNPLHWINKLNDAIGHTTADILQFLGITDPAVNPDGIRDIAKCWKALGDAVGDASFAAGQAITGLDLEGEVATAYFARAAQVRLVASNVETALHAGHDELNKLADQAHELISQVGVLAAQIAEFEVAGLALDLLTGPLGTAAATLAAGGRATRIVALFGEVEQVAVRAAKAVETLVEDIGGMTRILKALKAITKMAVAGAGGAVLFDVAFHPGHATDPEALKADLEWGAAGGAAFGLAGKAFANLLDGMGPLGPKFALAADGGGIGALSDLKGTLGSKFDDLLSTMQSRFENKWTRNGPKPPKLADEHLPHEQDILGGHTLEKHNEKGFQYLTDRIKSDSKIQNASTFTSYTEAKKYINLVIDDRRTEIETWLKGANNNATQPFEGEFPGQQIGMGVSADEVKQGIRPHPGEYVTVVFKRDTTVPDGYIILTSYPGRAAS